MWFLVLVAIIIAVLIITVRIFTHRTTRKFYHKTIPGKYIKSTGLLAMFDRFKPPKNVSLHDVMLQQYQKYGVEDGIFHTFMGPASSVDIVDPEAIKKIALDSKTFPKHPMLTNPNKNSTLYRFQGLNIVFADGQDWKSQRHVVNPAFGDLEQFYPVFQQYTDKILNKWADKVSTNGGKTLIPVMGEMTNFTIDVLGKAVFGIEFNAIDEKLTDIVESYTFLMKACQRLLHMLFPILDSLPTDYNKKINYHLERFDHMIYKIIDEARQRGEHTEGNKTLLDMMLDSENGAFDNKVLRDNCVVFFIAGHETTASALGFALYVLSKHQHVKKKLLEEIEQVIGMDSEPTYEQICSMEYLSCVIKECMRLYPSIPFIPPRLAAKDTELCGFHIPKGTMVSMSTYSLHHSEKVYGPDVEEFRPERWEGEEGQNIHKFAFMAFSAGKVCL
jgi:cytochrome P450